MNVDVVIGMNFGDEGKGHITNFLSNSNDLVVRFNGGTQAAHAVFLSDGRNHIFKHFGSGSLKGSRTLLSRKFIVNPIFFASEWTVLVKKALMKEVFIDPRCRVSTIYDMLINGYNSYYHKSNDTTGFGINETVERSVFKQLNISMRNLIDMNLSDLKNKLSVIRDEYVPWRLKKIGLPLDGYNEYCKSRIVDMKSADDSFIDTIKGMLKCIVVWSDDDIIDRYYAKDRNRKIVFEGAQGFRLDQNRMDLFPYLTRSNTGVQNVLECLKTVKTEIKNMNVYLVTRAYLTRHGDGPLWNETKLPYNITESTNPENQFQGKMKYGYLNKEWYDTAILETNNYIKKNLPKNIKNVKTSVAFTCLDQLEGKSIRFSNSDGVLVDRSLKDFDNVSIISEGCMDSDVRFYK